MVVKKITVEWLEEREACDSGVAWFKKQSKTDSVEVINSLVAEGRMDWANWIIVRVMDRPQYLTYAIYAAEQVLDIFEGAFPDENRPRRAIEAARAILQNDTAATRSVAWSAIGDVWSNPPRITWSANSAAQSAYFDASWEHAGDAAASAGSIAGVDIFLKILKYGLSLLEKETASVR